MTISRLLLRTGFALGWLSFSLTCLSCTEPAKASPPAEGVTFSHMTCEYLENPQGIDVTSPRFSWHEASNASGYAQQAYRIVISSSPARLAAGTGDMWDSGKVRSSRTTLVAYNGVTLKSRMQCWWAVQVWDSQGRRSAWSKTASFSMGLLSARDWKASWIGKDVEKDSVLHELTAAQWIWYPDAGQPNVSAPIGSRYFRLAVNVPTGRAIKQATFVGAVDNSFTLYVDGKEAGRGDDWYNAQTIDIGQLLHAGVNELAVKARNVGDSPNPAGFVGVLQIEYRDGGRTVIPTASQWKSSQTANAGWNTRSYDDSAWKPAMDLGPFGMQPWGNLPQGNEPLPARYLRREFTAPRQIAKATAYVCGLGFFELYINGKPATNHIMDPALSDYQKVDYYVTTDVTSLLHTGRNAIAVVLGNGRFHAPREIGAWSAATYGLPRLLMQLEITYTDGSKQTVVSDGSWMATDRGPIRANNEYDGEIYDARMAMSGWASPGYSASKSLWSPASIMDAPGGELRAQMIEPMRITNEIHPISIASPKPGVYVVDMGQSFYGTVRLNARAKRGTTVRLTSAYALLPDGTLKTADNRTAQSTDIYTFAGTGNESWNPVFKGQGYRRVQVTGFPGKPAINNFEGLDEHTDVRPVGTFSCSSTLVNKIHNAMRTGMTMFLRSAPLDPDRDERMAWMGDPAKDSESEAYNFDVAAFYTKWMDDVRRSQRANGSIPDQAMYWATGSGVEWPSVFTIIPDWYTGFYADNRVEQNNYAAMKRWVLEMQREHQRPDGTLEGTSYGDWCDTYSMDGKGPDSGSTSHDLITTAYQYNNVRIMQHAAERLGLTDDAVLWRNLGDTLQTAFMSKFFDPTTCTYTSGTQCSYVLPIAFGLVPNDSSERTQITNNLVRDIMVTHNRHLTVGLLGNQWLLQALSQSGRPDVAWNLVTQTTKPSWGYMIEHGSNTIWERWDYDTRDPGMNSEALLIQAGNVDAWFYQTLGGINYDPAKPGFAHILIHPHILGDLTWVNCSFDSPHGTIVSNWTRSGQNVTMKVTIPANTTATVTTPDGASHEMASGSRVLKSRL